MRSWKYLEPGVADEPVEVIVTEDQIRNEFYPWWQTQMAKVNKAHLVSFDSCVEDFVVVHWAEEIICP